VIYKARDTFVLPVVNIARDTYTQLIISHTCTTAANKTASKKQDLHTASQVSKQQFHTLTVDSKGSTVTTARDSKTDRQHQGMY
jgi:hypothetical protein